MELTHDGKSFDEAVATPPIEEGVETANERFARMEFADLVIRPYALEPNHVARLMARSGAMASEGDVSEDGDLTVIMDAVADLYEYIRDHCVLPGRRQEFVDAFQGRFDYAAEYVIAYMAAAGESSRSSE